MPGETMVIGGPNAVDAAMAATVAARGPRNARLTVHRLLLEADASARCRRLAERAQAVGLPVSVAGEGECDRIAGVRSQGIAAEISYTYAELEPLLEARAGLILFLDGISDPHNLGALIRTAEAAGALAVVIPGRRAAQVNATVMRVSAGAAVYLPVCRVTNLARDIEMARNAGFWVIGLHHQAEGLLPSGRDGLATVGNNSGRVGLALGSEGEGLHRLVAAGCDQLAKLPMSGRTESLNASVAAAVAIYRLLEGEVFGAATPPPVDTSRKG